MRILRPKEKTHKNRSEQKQETENKQQKPVNIELEQNETRVNAAIELGVNEKRSKPELLFKDRKI